jgi:uncharacterized protein (TIGR00369 family)
MSSFELRDPEVERRIRHSFARQGLMRTIGATLTRISAGEVDIEVPFQSALTQQHGYVHGAIVTAIVDNACGYAAMSLTPPGTEVLTVEYKVNFLEPARGARFVGRGRVVRSGRTFTVCTGEVFAIEAEEMVPVASMLTTIMTVSPKEPESHH